MNKIREKLIHFLGGVTVTESNHDSCISYRMGEKNTFHFILFVLRQRKEDSAEEWLAFVQKYIKEQHDKIHTELKSYG